MPARLDRYIMRNFLLGIIPVLLLLLCLFSLLEFAQALKDVGQGSFGMLDAIKVVVLTTPNRIVDLLPVTALLGCLMGLGAMANHHELIVIRTAGMSVRRIARPVIQVALALAGLVLVLQLLVISPTERKAVQVRSKALQKTEVGLKSKLDFWTRSQDTFVRVEEVKFDRSLTDIEIYQLDPSGHLTQVFQAAHADIVGVNDWLLTDVVQSDLSDFQAREEWRPTMNWRGLLSSEQASKLIMPLKALTPIDLFHYIRYLKENKLDTHRYRIAFWQQLSVPLSLLAMSVLSLPLLLGSVRHISAGQRVITGALVGVSFYLVQKIVGNLTGLYGLNPPLTLLAPSLVLLGIAAYGIYRPRNT